MGGRGPRFSPDQAGAQVPNRLKQFTSRSRMTHDQIGNDEPGVYSPARAERETVHQSRIPAEKALANFKRR